MELKGVFNWGVFGVALRVVLNWGIFRCGTEECVALLC